jgi:hypothetical protein
VAPNFVDGANVGVIEGRYTSCFTAKTFEGMWVPGCALRQELQSDKPAKLNVLGFVDYTHATAPQFFQDTVARDGLPGSGVRLSHTRC